MDCYFFWDHKWDKWSVTDEGTLTRGESVIAHYVVQRRECSKCGLKEFKTKKKVHTNI